MEFYHSLVTVSSEVCAQRALDLVDSDPAAALALALRVLEADDIDDVDRAMATWAQGWALRELHELDEASACLAEAVALARSLGMSNVVVRASVSLALTRMYQGDSSTALSILDDVAPAAAPADLVHVLLQRALIEHRLGDQSAALSGYFAALAAANGVGDGVGDDAGNGVGDGVGGGVGDGAADVVGDDTARARIHANLTVLYAERNDLDAAQTHASAARRMAARLGLDLLAAGTAHNLGYALARSGKVPEALRLMQQADDDVARLDGVDAQLAVMRLDHCEVLLGANLFDEALVLGERCVDVLAQLGNANERADADLLLARIHRATDDLVAAGAAAQRASTMYVRQGRRTFAALARLVELQASSGDTPAQGRARRAEAVAGDLGKAWPIEQAVALGLACRWYVEAGLLDDATRLVGQLRRVRNSSAVQRAAQFLAAGLVHEAAGRRSAARRAVTSGLRTLEENRRSIGPTELRAYATVHASELADLGTRLAVDDGRARDLLRVLESVRSQAASRPTGPVDAQVAAALTELRSVADALRSEDIDAEAAMQLAVRRRELEARIRTATRADGRSASAGSSSVGAAIEQLGARSLIEYTEVGGRLIAVTVSGGRARLHELGDVGAIRREIESTDFAVQRLQRAGASDRSRHSASVMLEASSALLAELVVPAALGGRDDEVVVVPSSSLLGLPWACLPPLRGRAIAVASSLADWAACNRRVPGDGSVGLIAGPDLRAAGREIDRLAKVHRTSSRLGAGTANTAGALEVIGTSAIAHIACHGAFRSDNPMFSSLRLADGELTVHDLAQCAELPHTFVMSACNTGQNAALRGGGLLGMASALMQLGVSSVIAPLTPVNDERSVELMVRLHTHLAAGLPAATALARASIADGVDGADGAGGDADGEIGSIDPTAAPFVCFGS